MKHIFIVLFCRVSAIKRTPILARRYLHDVDVEILIDDQIDADHFEKVGRRGQAEILSSSHQRHFPTEQHGSDGLVHLVQEVTINYQAFQVWFKSWPSNIMLLWASQSHHLVINIGKTKITTTTLYFETKTTWSWLITLTFLQLSTGPLTRVQC